MKTKNKPHFVIMATIVAVFAALTWSCNKDDDPSLSDLREDKLQFLQDSLRISDSLRLTNNAGIVNYAVTVVDGSASSIYANDEDDYGRSNKTLSAIEGAVVTISQYGKTQTDTTDASGMVVFNGFFRSAVNITVNRTDYTSVSYISGVNITDSTRTGTISFVGNIVPIFAKTGPNTATISGRATIQTDLTNKTRELIPDGTTVSASIDASNNSDFADKFLTLDIDDKIFEASCGCQFIYVGYILQASYDAGVVGAVTGGNYTVTVPAAVDGLPTNLQYSEIGADQTLFEDGANGQRTIVRRTIFNDNSGLSDPIATLPASSSVNIGFVSYSVQATANAVTSNATGAVAQINVTNGGSGYVGTPLVEITGDGTGATATATVGANGKVTGITLTSPGTGYTAPPTVNIISGSGADFVTTLGGTGTVVALNLLTTGEGYTSAPTVAITGGGATTDATATATVANGRVTGLTLVTGGAGYDGTAITVTITGGGATADATASAVFSGLSVNQVVRISGGADYTYAPVVEFSAPERPTGVRATGTAVIDADTREVVAINVTNSGSGYTNPPVITLSAGGGAAAQAYLEGGSVISFEITNEGADYAYPPTVVIGSLNSGNGTGATGTAIMSGGRVVGITVTNGGTGYTGTPDVILESGTGAVAYATVTDGVITGLTVTDGGHDFAGAPRVTITSVDGGGATATATVAGGQITGLTVVNGGSGYLEGNTPGAAERFSATKDTFLETKPGITYINDVYYGTGAHRE